MPRSVTLFTGQWADLSLRGINGEKGQSKPLLEMIKRFGYDGVELACWGDHFDVGLVLSDQGYRDGLRSDIEKAGLVCRAVSAHLVGQAVCDLIDERHKAILPPHVWGDGKPEGVRQRAQKELIKTIEAARLFGVDVVNGFTGSSIWHLLYSFPPVLPGQINAGYEDFAKRFAPILVACKKHNVRFALEVHPTEIAFDIASAERALAAIKDLPGQEYFGFNYDPSHLGYQGVNYVAFIRKFYDRIFHVHMKDVAWNLGDEAGVFGGNVDFHKPNRYWDFKSMGRGDINFERIIRALNDIGYTGPLSVEWEDGGMDREHGAVESCAYVKKIDFPPSSIVFDAQFDKSKQKKK